MLSAEKLLIGLENGNIDRDSFELNMFYLRVHELNLELKMLKMADNELHNFFYSLAKVTDKEIFNSLYVENSEVVNALELYQSFTHWDVQEAIESIWYYTE